MNRESITTVYDLLLRSKEEHGAVAAIESSRGKITYGELFHMVWKLACSYQTMDMCGKKVDLYAELSVDWIIAYLALLTAGAEVVLYEPGFEISYSKDDGILSGKAEELISVKQQEGEGKYKKPDGNDVATIIYTSGTTGKPKGVMLTQKNIVQDAILGYERIGTINLSPGDFTIPVLPVYHMYGITASIFASLYIGMTVYVLDDIKYLLKRLPEIKPKVLYLVPMIVRTIYERMQVLLNTRKIPEEILKTMIFGENIDLIVSGGAPLDIKMIDFFASVGIHLLNGYGITECSPIVTVCNKQKNKKGSVGNVTDMDNVQVKIINDTVHVSGDIVMKGYADGNEDDFYYENGRRWFNTNDLGRIDDEGYLFITGRKKNLIILEDGNNIAPEALEACFNKYEMIAESVIYVNEENTVPMLGVYIRLDQAFLEGEEQDRIERKVQSIIDEINDKQPLYKQVRCFYIVEEFPRNKGGKILRDEITILKTDH